MRRVPCAVLVLSLLCSSAVAAPPAAVLDPKEKLTSELLDLSGTRRQIESLPDVLKQSFQPQGFSMMNPAVLKMLQEAAERTIDAASMYRVVHQHVKAAGSADDLARAVEMVRSPLALKFTQWEVESSKAESLGAMQAFMLEIEKTPPDKARIQLVSTIDDLSGASRLVVEINMAQFFATARAVRETFPPERRRSDEALAKDGESFRTQVAPATKNQIVTSMLFAYRNATMAELQQYAELLDSKTGRWLNGCLMAGYRSALGSAMAAMGRDFGSRLGKEMQKPASPAPKASPR